MLLRILVLAIAASYVVFRGYLGVQLVRARRAGDTDRERAALAWTEAVTLVADGHVPDSVYEEARPHFSQKELANLTLAVATINAWNRLAIASRTEPGTYQPAKARDSKEKA